MYRLGPIEVSRGAEEPHGATEAKVTMWDLLCFPRLLHMLHLALSSVHVCFYD
jgi:hypothetical protein